MALGAALFPLAASEATERSSDAPALLAEARQALAWAGHTSERLRVVYSDESGFPHRSAFKVESIVERLVAADGRLHIRQTLNLLEADGQRLPTPFTNESIYTGTQRLQITGSTEVRDARYSVMAGPGEVARLRQLDLAQVKYGGFMVGLIAASEEGAVSVIDLALRSAATARVSKERIGDAECRVVAAETPAGALKLWIAPDRGFALLRFSLDQVRPGRQLRECHVLFDGGELAEMAGRTVLRTGTFRAKYVGLDGGEVTMNATAERLDLQVDPQFPSWSFASSAIPEGAPVTDIDLIGSGSPLRHRWKGGKAVPDVDKEVLEMIEMDVLAERGGASATRPGPATSTTVPASQ